MEEQWDEIPKHLTVTKTLTEWARGDFTVKDSQFSFKGMALPSNLNNRIIQMATNGEDPQRLFNFWARLQKNPSMRSVEQLFGFLNHEHIPITPDGCFLAYKSVRSDYMDKYSGTWSNKPGSLNKMPRNQISDDPQKDCHYGFHVGAMGYAKSFGGSRMVICKVDPEHVVCVPYDHSQEKMRVCEYKVVGEWNGEPMSSTTVDSFDEPESVLGKEETPVQKPEKFVPKKSKPGFSKFDKMDIDGLLECTIDDLRQYAFKGLEIVGASKIPGGKVALVNRIKQVREGDGTNDAD